jgi:UrcA family protein
VLYKRIQVAAKQVCGTVEGRDLRGVQAHDACVERAVSDAVGVVNNRMTTQVVAQVR